jgi:hypothetical protein
LRPRQLFRLARRLADTCRVEGLQDDDLGLGGMLLEVLPELLVDERLDVATDVAVAELGLRLPLELRMRELHADHGGQTLAGVLALQRLAAFQQVGGGRVGVERARQGALEAGEMGAALHGVDVVGEGEDRLGVSLVPLQRDLDLDGLFGAGERDHRRVDRRLGAVQVADELLDAAAVEEFVLLLRRLFLDDDANAAIEERELTQAMREEVKAEVHALEDLGVGLEGHLGAGLIAGADQRQRRLRLAAVKPLRVHLAVALDLDRQHRRQRVHHRHADAVETAGDGVGTGIELAAGVQLGQHDLGGGNAFLGVDLGGNAAAVVLDRHRPIDVQHDEDVGAVTRHRFVDRIVHHLEHQVVQAPLGGIADVHARAFAHRLETFEDGDLLGSVITP